jgi:hypothetical protein
MNKFVAVAVLGLAECALFATPCLGQDASKVVVTDPAYTKAQRLVEVDHGRRMNIYCRGKGSPTVVFDAGLGDSSSSWGLVQPASCQDEGVFVRQSGTRLQRSGEPSQHGEKYR